MRVVDWMILHGVYCAVPTNGAERGWPDGSKQVGMYRLRVSDTSRLFTSRGTDWGWGIRGAFVGVGSPALSGVSYGEARPGVHDSDSGDVDGESGT